MHLRVGTQIDACQRLFALFDGDGGSALLLTGCCVRFS
jgi:hypothetical protein